MAVLVAARIIAAAVFATAAFATLEADRAEREKELIKLAQQCRDHVHESFFLRHCSRSYFEQECNSISLTCLPESDTAHLVVCEHSTGYEMREGLVTCPSKSVLPVYEEKLVEQAAVTPLVDAVCEKRSQPIPCSTVLQILKGPVATTLVSLSLPLAVQKLADYFGQQLLGFFKKNCESAVLRNKQLKVTCLPDNAPPAYATAEITCGGLQKKKLSLEEIANGYEPTDKPVHAKKSYNALVALLCAKRGDVYTVSTADELKDRVKAAAQTVDLTRAVAYKTWSKSAK